MAERRLRCAAYTRKSTEEGLDQQFNSLQAQREACEAYIASQKSEGWSLLRTAYDDGGFSGGSLARPALQRLLADIASGQIDIVVVYKVDRLTRSLADFAKIVEAFDCQGVSFVSVTQAFNTTTSMGRLTLNVLLSFAQFEREVTAERIRDKIAASKAKGLWMGGVPPLGYRVEERKLVVVPKEAEQVRHRDQVYPGEQEAIVDAALWAAAQQKLADRRVTHRLRVAGKSPSLLTGLAFDAQGKRLTPTHAVKQGKRYRYYATVALCQQDAQRATRWRIPAADLERHVSHQLQQHLNDPHWLLEQMGAGLTSSAAAVIDKARQIAAEAAEGYRAPALRQECGRVRSRGCRRRLRRRERAPCDPKGPARLPSA